MRHVRHISTVTDPATGKVYPIPAGGSGEGEGEGGGTSGEGGNGGEGPEIDGDPSALGDPGKKALDSMKEQWKAERDRANSEAEARKKQADDMKELQAQVAELQGRKKEWEAEQADREKEQKFLAQANERILKAEIRAAAKGVLVKPEVAFKFLDLSSFEVDDDGNVDEKAINKALEDLIEKEPYLAVQDGRRFKGSADGGARNGSTKPSQLTQADLAGMSPEQIVKAKEEGQLDDVLGRSD